MPLPRFRKLEPHEMGTGGVTHTLLTLAIPAALSGLLNAIYEMVDRLFNSWLGHEQVTGVGLGLPVIFSVWALGAPIGIGVATLVSRRLGEKRHDEARRILDHALLIVLVVGGLLSIIGPVIARPILATFGPSPDVLNYATQYLTMIMAGALFFQMTIAGEAGLRAQGNTITPMRIMIVGNLINIFFDGFFIFGRHNLPAHMPELWGFKQTLTNIFTHYGLDMGVRGAAVVTVASRLVTGLALWGCLASHRSHVRPSNPLITLRDFRMKTVLEIYSLGLPMGVAISSMALAAFVVNYILTDFNEIAVGTLVAATSLEMFAFVPIFSLGNAVVPLVSFNLGAQLFHRCRRAIFVSCGIAGGLMAAVGAVLFTFPRDFLGLFTDNQAMLDMGSSYLRINSWSYLIIGWDIMLSSGFQGLNRPILSMFMQLIRTLIVKAPAAYLLSLVLGVTGVWWSSPISTIACFITASITMTWLLRRLARQHAGIPPGTMPPNASPGSPTQLAADPPK